MAEKTASIADFSLVSRWENNASGNISSGPTTASASKTATIAGIPEGATIEGAELSANFGSPYTGGSLQVNGENVNYGGARIIELTPTESGNGDYTITFSFRANGATGLSQGSHSASVGVRDAVVTVTYSDEPPTPPPEPEPEIDWGGDRPISVFDRMNIDRFNNNGVAVLTPSYGRGKSIAGAENSITLRHPVGPSGKWQYLVPDAIIRVPVPEETIENAFAGIEVDLYRTNQSAAMRAGPSEPSPITYQEWTYTKATTTGYTVGEKVTCSGAGNYQCLYWDSSSGQVEVPPYNSSWWKKIASQTSGASVLVQLASGQDLYFLEDAGSGWYYMSTPEGIEGYVKASQVTFVQHLTPEDSQERTIRDQLYRIVESTIDTNTWEVEVYAEHVSYDLAAILVRDVEINKATPAFAINRVLDGLLVPYRGTVSTNLTTANYGTYTGKINGKNGIFAFLDPDSGIVPTFQARFTRDNWDLFILQNNHRDRGVRIEIGKNAKAIKWTRSRRSLALRIVPVAKDEDGNDYYLPEVYIESQNVNENPVKYMYRLSVKGQLGKDDGTDTNTRWTPETLCAEMRKEAQEYLDINRADILYEEITLEFEQRGDSTKYAWLKDLEQILLYDTVHVGCESIGLDRAMEVTEIEWDFVKQKRPKITKIKVSTSISQSLISVAGYNIGDNSIGAEKLTEAAITEIANLLT